MTDQVLTAELRFQRCQKIRKHETLLQRKRPPRANSYTSITSRVSQTTLIDFSKNLEELSPIENEEEIDDQIRSTDSHEIQCEKEFEIDLRADTGTLFFPDRSVISTIDH